MKSEPLQRLSVGFLTACLLVALAGLFINDPLLYRSPLIDIATVAAFFGLVGTACLLAVFWPLARFVGHSLPRNLGAATTVGLAVSGFAISGLEAVTGASLSPAIFFAAVGLIVLAALATSRRISAVTVERIRLAGLYGLVAAVALVAGRIAWAATETGRFSEDNARHAVVVVIDGWPSQFWNSYEPAQEAGPIDALAQQGQLFTASYSSKLYTWGWFSVFYTGRRDATIDQQVAGFDLLGDLEDEGVNTRIVNFHSNGLADSAVPTDRRVFRSSLLTERYAWIPQLLGLDYDVFLGWPGTRGNLPTRARITYDAISGTFDEVELWRSFFPRQIYALQSRNRPSLLIVHVNHNLSTVQSLGEGVEDKAIRQLYEKAGLNGYRYDPSDESVMELVRTKYAKRTELWGRRLSDLHRQIQNANGQYLTVVTGDHGSILSRGKIWYGHHIDEEVTRVPMLLLGSGIEPGKRNEPVDTLDLNASVQDFFGIDSRGEGRSLLPGQQVQSRTIASLGLVDPVTAERLIALYSDGLKYVFDISPSGDAGSRIERYQGFEEAAPQISPVPAQHPIWGELSEALLRYGLERDEVHPDIWAATR
ncbi:sulfatase-like hydrolase/transferase [Algihabitans sp.]|uniref:sulfatase-like hydrolase/transferase n=1 Tax=Algihabitans sp. TaxID=2821514 RepID=UPI003BA9CCFA